jgi:hypothetical protein
MRIEVTGADGFYRLAHALNEAGDRGLKRELDRGGREAGEVIADAVTDPVSIAKYIPRNFEHRFQMAVRARVDVSSIRSRRVRAVIWADGKTVRRDIVAMNKGILKHPVFGRFRRLADGTLQANPWVSSPPQRIRPGLVTEPAAAAMPAAIQKIDDAVGRVVDKINRRG